MEEEKTAIKNGIAVFRRPLRIHGRIVYGIIYNKDNEYAKKKLHMFLSYVLGMEQFLRNGGQTDKSKRVWKIPEGYKVECDQGLHALIYNLLKNYTKFGILEFDKPLEYTADEIDDGFIVGKSFMDRYVFCNPDKIEYQ